MQSGNIQMGGGGKGLQLAGITLLILCAAVFIGYLTAQQLKAGEGFVAGLVGGTLVIACMINPTAGLTINLVYSFTAFHLSRWLTNDTFPVGVVSDTLIFATFFGYIFRKAPLRPTVQSFFQSPVVLCFLVYLGFGLLEAFNLNARSFAGWFLGMRKMAGTYALLFVAYEVFKDKTQVRRFLRVVFYGCVVLGLYGCAQQVVGLFGFERNWVMEDPLRFGLIYINGEFRKFSMLSDPTQYGMLMAACSLFFLIMSMTEQGWKAWRLRLGTVPMLLGMLYSGTRTANFMLVAGLGFFVLLTIDRKASKIVAVLGAVALALVLYLPIYGNNTINRFRSTFQGSQDQSFLVREMNRHYIQPYIWSHPIGGGLCTTGNAGIQYNPGHYLAGFPTDDDYLLKALETGWIGLGLLCVLYFLVLRTGIRAYFRTKDPRDKFLAAGCTAVIFSYYVASYTQLALGSISDIVIYYPFIAILIRLNESGQPSS